MIEKLLVYFLLVYIGLEVIAKIYLIKGEIMTYTLREYAGWTIVDIIIISLICIYLAPLVSGLSLYVLGGVVGIFLLDIWGNLRRIVKNKLKVEIKPIVRMFWCMIYTIEVILIW